MSRRITIDPITRLEGHGKVEIFLDEQGNVANAYLQIPELRGFEKFCVGRAAEDMPNLTARICGVCPTSHGLAAAYALDEAYGVNGAISDNGRTLRNLIQGANYVQSHILHFYQLAALDYVDVAACADYTGGDPEWTNLGQGQPEVGLYEGAPPRIDQVTIRPEDHAYGRLEGIDELRGEDKGDHGQDQQLPGRARPR